MNSTLLQNGEADESGREAVVTLPISGDLEESRRTVDKKNPADTAGFFCEPNRLLLADHVDVRGTGREREEAAARNVDRHLAGLGSRGENDFRRPLLLRREQRREATLAREFRCGNDDLRRAAQRDDGFAIVGRLDVHQRGSLAVVVGSALLRAVQRERRLNGSCGDVLNAGCVTNNEGYSSFGRVRTKLDENRHAFVRGELYAVALRRQRRRDARTVEVPRKRLSRTRTRVRVQIRQERTAGRKVLRRDHTLTAAGRKRNCGSQCRETGTNN